MFFYNVINFQPGVAVYCDALNSQLGIFLRVNGQEENPLVLDAATLHLPNTSLYKFPGYRKAAFISFFAYNSW